MLARAALAICLLLCGPLARASERIDIATWPVTRCTPSNVAGAMIYNSVRREAKIAKELLPVYTEIQSLAAKATNPNKSVGSQLSPAANERFGELRQRAIALQTRNYVESVYQKHIELISRMAQAQDEIYRWGKYPEKSEKYYLADLAPYALQRLYPVSENTPPKGNQCSLDGALATLESGSLRAITSPRMENMLATLRSLQAKYGVKNLNQASMSDEDRKTYEAARKILNEAKLETENIDIVEQIRRMAAAATLIYSSDQKDVDASMGDPRSIGKTLHAMQMSGKFSPATQESIGLWAKLDAKYPCEAIKQQEAAFKVQQRLGIRPSEAPVK